MIVLPCHISSNKCKIPVNVQLLPMNELRSFQWKRRQQLENAKIPWLFIYFTTCIKEHNMFVLNWMWFWQFLIVIIKDNQFEKLSILSLKINHQLHILEKEKALIIIPENVSPVLLYFRRKVKSRWTKGFCINKFICFY